jgi:hypothetical protein
MTRFRFWIRGFEFAPTPLWRLGNNTAPSAKARLTPFRLVKREVAEHGCFVCGAVVLVLARLQLDRHRLLPLEANGREVFGGADVGTRTWVPRGASSLRGTGPSPKWAGTQVG